MDPPLEAGQVSPENTVQDSAEDIKTAVATLEPPPTIHISNYRISHVYLNFRPMTYYAHVTKTIYDLNRLRIPLEHRNEVEEKRSGSEPKDVNQEKGKMDVLGVSDRWTCDYKWLVTFMGS
ncbi:uncharacterized protein MELLADRAFT_68915 [Melampsora larici-populina 98AG31]|uniref:Uncharacterized protein n=1 Tax=Melampsora larici-populina (strain 98AG31 / pathotype 3-4-7) TaxID=747676 RepID=F4S8P5_MELLP|nr:uncharacterized protein MELLADRAFT_68915 [Melampsora larici-populina 98AG31]EGF98931.1 hypothetical protein MELLADRAFT_68915 [Melampsora larici-populina 98AG31]